MGLKKIQNELGRRLRALRLERNVTQEELSFETGISRDHISHIENGKHPINLKNLYKLSVYFGVDIKYFF